MSDLLHKSASRVLTALVPTAIACGITVAASGTAQGTRVFPIPYQSQPAEGAMSAPYTLSNTHPRRTSRSITVYDARTLPFGAGSVIDGIAFRRDAQDPQNYPAFSGNVQVRIGASPSAENPYANGHHVFEEQSSLAYSGTIQVPASARPTGGNAAPFSLAIQFDQPWTYPGGDFAIDLHFDGPASALWRRDAVRIEDGRDGVFTVRGGIGVEGPQGFAPHIWTEPDLAVPGGAFVFHLDQAPQIRPGGLAINFLGTDATQAAGRPLPIALPNPLFPAGTELRTEILAFQAAPTGDFSESFARSVVTWPISISTSLVGHSFASQWWVVDLGLQNQLPLLTSDAIEVEIGLPSTTSGIHYGRTMWAYGQRGDSNLGLELGERNYVPVTQFTGTFAP